MAVSSDGTRRGTAGLWGQPEGLVINHFWRLSAAGFAATAVSFGPGRMGFGLFVPEFRTEFGMSTATVGFVSSLGFLGFFMGLLIAQALLDRRGPGLPVLSGLFAAAIGMGIVASAPDVFVLATGVFVAASSAGLAWTPFNNAIHQKVREEERASALSIVSTGTGIGIALAGLAALLMVDGGLSWRYAWALFAGAGALALLGNWMAFRRVGRQSGGGPQPGWRDMARAAIIPLCIIGFAYGTTSAIYIAFAADHVVASGGVPGLPVAATPALLYICYGLVGLAGLLTARIRDRLGLLLLLRLLLLAGAMSLALVALAPGAWAGLILSAGLQGLHVMMMSALLAFWSERLFPDLPSLSFTAVLLAAALGNVFGPAVAGLASGAYGAAAMFLGAAALPAIVALLLRDRHARERPVGIA